MRLRNLLAIFVQQLLVQRVRSVAQVPTVLSVPVVRIAAERRFWGSPGLLALKLPNRMGERLARGRMLMLN